MFTFGIGLTVPVPQALALVTAFDRDTVIRYDLAPDSGLNSVTVLEIGRLVASGMVALSMEQASHLVSIAPSAPWQDVPADARLEDAGPTSQLYAAASALYDHFRAHGVQDAIVSKLLHLKRPALVPILDSLAKNVYQVAATQQAAQFPQLGVAHLYWQAIRIDLIRPGDIQAIAELRSQLTAHPDRHYQLLATLSTLRLRDIILWMSQQGNPGIAGNPRTPPETP